MRKPISEDIQWIIIRLSTAMSPEDVAMYTDVSQRKVNDVISFFNKYDTVPHTYSWSLWDDDDQVSLCLSLRSTGFSQLATTSTSSGLCNLEADLYFNELRQDLELQTGTISCSSQPQMMPPLGFPPMMGAPFYPGWFINPWSIPQGMVGHGGFKVNNGMMSSPTFAAYDMLLFTTDCRSKSSSWCTIRSHTNA
jgi:hypothetical protein